MPTRDRVLIAALSLAWVLASAVFWHWWLQPSHRAGVAGMVINSLLLVYLSLIPAYFVLTINRMRQINPMIEIPRLRVAFVVTRAPSEPWPKVRTTLLAMLEQWFPFAYDVWLCDEDPTEEIIAWCESSGVRVSSRRGEAEYHRSTWPRRTRCKEGNLAYFYDHWGYRDYDVVAQLDCDHVPDRTYLAEMVRPFADPAVGYVAAPSICDANSGDSWAARGRLHREATFHGPVQSGHLVPLCIGSHYAVRTEALREIGGLGPELAEDFSTTFLMNSAGWSGAFAIDAPSHGDGPSTFTAMITQEFQWSRSLMTLLIGLVPRHLGRLRWPMRLRFLFTLTYYPLLVGMTVVGMALPPIAAITGASWVNVNYFVFLIYWWLISVWPMALLLLLRRRGVLRPRRIPVFSWEGWLFQLSRWPYAALGVGAAVLDALRPRAIEFKVTPKVRRGLERLPARVVMPYAAISVMLSVAALIGELFTSAAGYVFFCLLAAIAYAVVGIVVPILHAVEVARTNGWSAGAVVARTASVPLRIGIAVLLPLTTAITIYPTYASQIFGW